MKADGGGTETERGGRTSRGGLENGRAIGAAAEAAEASVGKETGIDESGGETKIEYTDSEEEEEATEIELSE